MIYLFRPMYFVNHSRRSIALADSYDIIGQLKGLKSCGWSFDDLIEIVESIKKIENYNIVSSY